MTGLLGPLLHTIRISWRLTERTYFRTIWKAVAGNDTHLSNQSAIGIGVCSTGGFNSCGHSVCPWTVSSGTGQVWLHLQMVILAAVARLVIFISLQTLYTVVAFGNYFIKYRSFLLQHWHISRRRPYHWLQNLLRVIQFKRSGESAKPGLRADFS